MRHINIQDLMPLLPPRWESRAQRALEKIRNLPHNQRARAINRRAILWRDLTIALSSLSSDKCWYCESRQIRSDKSVDHFRPKNSIAECPTHEGYWWLAFNWLNYRFSCGYCNSRHTNVTTGGGGKHDHFPLLDETRRAYQETDELNFEEPELLDPTVLVDTTLIWFTEDGRAVETLNEESYPIQFKRAKTSIKLYHLNHPDVVQARMDLFNEIHDLVNDGDVHFHSWQAGNLAARHGCARVIEQLRGKLHATKEYSVAARALLMGLRDLNHPWIDAVFTQL